MAKIEQKREIRLENVLSLRKKMTQTEINDEMMKIGRLLEEKGIRKNGPIVTATFAVEMINGLQVLDMEILLPMDQKVDLAGEYKLKEIFHLVNAVYAQHEGNPAMLQNTYNDMLEYMQRNNLQQITAGYNVQVKDPVPGQSPEDMTIDVYIGVNPSLL